MEILKITILSITSFITLFILTKLIGCREISHLTMFDYINSITIGSIAAEMATSLEDNFMQPLVAMIVYGLLIVLISIISNKSIKLRRIINGKSSILLDNGILYKESFKKAKLDIGEFLIACRDKGYFNLSDIQTAILEPNGKISILPNVKKRNTTPEDLNLSPKQEQIVSNIIIDGVLLKDNLKSTGKNETWLQKELNKQSISNIKDVFLATCDSNNNLSVYVKIKEKIQRDAFV